MVSAGGKDKFIRIVCEMIISIQKLGPLGAK